MIQNWPEQIAVGILVKQALAEVDAERLWPYHLPEVAATQEELRLCEQQLRHPLDPRYRAFLEAANGWRGFYQSVDLFGTADLIGGQRMQRARELLGAIEAEALANTGCTKEELLPIAATEEDMDLFLIVRPFSRRAGEVLWTAGREIERYPNFDEYFLAMIDYNRTETEALMQRNPP